MTSYATTQSRHFDIALLLASDPRAADDWARFVQTLYADHAFHGYISQNRVRVALSNEYGLTIEPRAYSGYWLRARRGKKSGLDRHDELISWHGYEITETSRSGNNGRLQPTYTWIGPTP